MGLMDKIKNMFTEEEEIEEEPIKKEVIQVEIPSPMPRKEEKKVEQVKVQEKVEKVEKIEKPVKQEEKFIFPVYFDESDFGTIEKKQKEEKKVYEEKRVLEEKRHFEEKKVTPKPISDSYKGKTVVEEKKTFKPTPIISPVYGVLDKNYTKEDITTKKHDEVKKVDEVDLIRNKAYGTLEDEIVDSLNYEEKPHKNTDMEEYHKKMNEVDFEEILESDIDLDDNLDELESKLTKASKTTEVQPKYSRSRKKELEAKDINENELFNMIDTMYEEEK